jgi:thiol-disulfide isomerase/thioredoxin
MNREKIEAGTVAGILAFLLLLAITVHVCCRKTLTSPAIAVTQVAPQKAPAPIPAPAPIAETYDAAARQSAAINQPGVLLLTASWCGSCKRFEREILPDVRKAGSLSPPYLGIVDVDAQKQVAAQLFGADKHIPQLVKFEAKLSGGTVSVTPTERLIGLKSPATVKAFLKAKPGPVPPATAAPVQSPPGPDASCDGVPGEAQAAPSPRRRLFHRNQ